MEKVIKAVIDIEITNIDVKEDSFSFDYKILKDGELVVKDKHIGNLPLSDNMGGFKKFLEDGHAVRTAMFLFSLDAPKEDPRNIYKNN